MTTKNKAYGTKEFEKEFGPITFGLLLESYRLAEELSQKDLAEQLGISQSSLCDLEKCRKIPSPSRAAKMAKILGVGQKHWVEVALQDQLREQGLSWKVSVA